jgi:hypothetical protein
MKKTLFVIAGCCLMVASQMNAATISELIIDAGGGTTADLTVDSLGAVSCGGSGCGGLTFDPVIVPHGTLNVTGSIGMFTISTLAGVGGIGVTPPALLNLTQNDATSTGAGTLTISWSDTDYGLPGGGNPWGSNFNISVQSNPDNAIVASTVNGQALADAANTLGGGTILDTFSLTGVSSHVNTVANPTGSSTGSLTAITQLNFSGTGHIQSTFTISSAGSGTVPEPGTVGLLGLGAGVFFLKLRRKRA